MAAASHLAQSNLWWTGPQWLQQDESSWPDTVPPGDEPPERRTNVQLLTTFQDTSERLIFFERFSSLRKVFLITAYIHHFVQKLRRKSKPEPLHPDTLTQAKFHILRIDQREHFVTEYELLQHDKSLPKNHQLQNLTPFFDTDYNIIRVGGRLGQSPYCESKKFPVLVSKNSKLVSLIIRHFHEASLHGGGQLTLNLIRQEYWITNAKPLVNSFIKECITCFRFSTTPPVQIMADLPSSESQPRGPSHTVAWTSQDTSSSNTVLMTRSSTT